MNILGIGEAVVDHTSVVRRDHKSDSVEVLETGHDAGGPVLSALILMSRLGASCTFVTSLGSDMQGKLIRGTLRKEKITLSINKQSQTKRHTVLVDIKTGEREKLRGNIEHDPIDHIDPELIRKADIIIIDRHERSLFAQVIKHKSPTAQLITDPSTEVSPFTLTMMAQSTCPIVPIEALAEFSAGENLKHALQKFFAHCQKTFVITLGDLGSIVYDGRKIKHVLPFAISPIDRTGAGDVYRGAFAHALSLGKSIEECAIFSNAAAALQCTKHGNATAVPLKSELERCMQQAKRRKVHYHEVKARFADISNANELPRPRRNSLFNRMSELLVMSQI